jgi:hypothetical protein
MEKFLLLDEVKVLPEFVNSIDTKYLNQRVRNHRQRIQWMYQICQIQQFIKKSDESIQAIK